MKAEDYLPLVKYIVGRLQVKLPPYLDSEDLLSYGIFGLLEAMAKYDPERGIKFETYATPRIRGAVLDAVRKASWAPRSTWEQVKEYNRVVQKLEQELGGEVPDVLIAKELGISQEELEQLLIEVNSVAVESLENFLLATEEGGLTLGDTVIDEKSPNPESILEEQELKAALVQAIERLGEKDRLLLSLYYYEELTLKEIGKVLDVSESRVCQLHARALSRLREELKEFGVKTG
ncbi:FliA/WhiG family RNA polymerase sigma factor [Zhaonella formicivorans]|uniref:FliA/WhiG family RNA polymerase sigma factor n=1 Tax=Zhaonella formicivorans TaxID=2528593 RepID=UPI0010E3B138|nr:FliA/WhiG family RNA polymerase sigma factor [Zhaonella formicivorans]